MQSILRVSVHSKLNGLASRRIKAYPLNICMYDTSTWTLAV